MTPSIRLDAPSFPPHEALVGFVADAYTLDPRRGGSTAQKLEPLAKAIQQARHDSRFSEHVKQCAEGFAELQAKQLKAVNEQLDAEEHKKFPSKERIALFTQKKNAWMSFNMTPYTLGALASSILFSAGQSTKSTTSSYDLGAINQHWKTLTSPPIERRNPVEKASARSFMEAYRANDAQRREREKHGPLLMREENDMLHPPRFAPQAPLQEMILAGLFLRGIIAPESHLEKAIVSDSDLAHSTLCGAHADGIVASAVVLTDSNLRDAQFPNGALDHGDFRGSCIMQARFTDSRLQYARFDGGNTEFAVYDPIKKVATEAVDFHGSDLSFANFTCSDVRGLNFETTCMHGSILRGTNLGSCNLRGVDVSHAQFGSVETEYDRGDALESSPRIFKSSLRDACCVGANFSNTDLRDVDLAGTDFSGATLHNVILDAKKIRKTIFIDADMHGITLVNAEHLDERQKLLFAGAKCIIGDQLPE